MQKSYPSTCIFLQGNKSTRTTTLLIETTLKSKLQGLDSKCEKEYPKKA